MSIFKLGSILEVDFLYLCIYVQTQKYAGSRFSKLMKFLLKLRSILEVDFLNLCIYFQTQKYTASWFSKLMQFLFKLRSILEAELGKSYRENQIGA